MNINQRIAMIHADATRRVGRLASELVAAKSPDREAVLAEMEFCRWIGQACEDCFD